MSRAIATAMGITRWTDEALATSSTARISSVAYAFDERGSEENTGSAMSLDRSVCSS
jgi:hypothetical protein